jgi:antitoxin component YwqK of YwqJK toxin-antitoxin module
MTPVFWRTRFTSIIRKFFTDLFNVKPKDKHDYYSVGRWLVSKKLAYTLVVLIGIASLYYVLVLSPAAVLNKDTAGNASLPVYKYNSLAIRFFEGDCRVKARDGHIAYEGAINNGEAKGAGRLFERDGTLIYDGAFDQNMYNGEGRLYYYGGELNYEGGFRNNLMNGEGKLYSDSGSLVYEGEFLKNMKNGVGTLYNAAATEIYKGNFVLDHIPYEEFVGKTTEETAGMYLGRQTIYASEAEFAVSMDEIDAVVQSTNGEDDLEGEGSISSITVLKDEFFFGGKSYEDISELIAYFGDPDYAGFTYCTLTDAVAINRLPNKNLMPSVSIDTQGLFNNVHQVDDYDRNVEVYIYAFKKDNAMYTFYCTDTGEKTFFMYQIEVGV